MPQAPYPITADSIEDLKKQLWDIIRELFEERIAGLSVGDVFSDVGDTLSLNLKSTGGLEKSSGELQVKAKSDGGIATASTGTYVKCKTGGDLDTDSDGIFVALAVSENSVDSQHYVDGSIDTEHIADNQIDSQHYAAGSIDLEHMSSSSVDADNLKTTVQNVDHTDDGIVRVACTGAGFCFAPMAFYDWASGSTTEVGILWGYHGVDTTGTPTLWELDSYAADIANSGWITLYTEDATWVDAYADVNYVAASGEVFWIFVLMRNGKIASTSSASDHPAYGNGVMEVPFSPADYDLSKGDEIILINPTLDEVQRINARCLPKEGGGFLTRKDIKAGAKRDYMAAKKPFNKVFRELFEIQESKQADFPDIPVTVALPDVHEGVVVSDWRMMPQKIYNSETKLWEGVKVESIKRVIPRPDFVTPLQIRERVVK